MLYAISGSQGSGKSTVIAELSRSGYEVVPRKTARSVLSDWGVTLQEVNRDLDLTVKYQEELLDRKVFDEDYNSRPHSVVFTERTYADLFSYALFTLGKHNDYSEWLNTYHAKCMKYQQTYAGVFYLKAGYFLPKHDGVRGSNHHYSRMADMTMLDVTTTMTRPGRLVVVDTGCLQQRVSSIMSMTDPNYN
jgi:predicted ATPase